MFRFVIVVAVVVGFGACEPTSDAEQAPAPRPSTATTATDSAGIRVVENGAPRWADGTEWTLESAPDLVVGVTDGDTDQMLDRVTGIVSLADGGIAVADLASTEIRFFDPEGRFLSRLGRKGEGPGEFQQILGLVRLQGDSLGVVDRRMGLMVFDRAGEYGRSATFARLTADLHPIGYHERRSFPVIVGTFPDGTFVTRDGGTVSLAELRRSEVPLHPEVSFTLRLPDGTESHILARLPSRSYAPHPQPEVLPILFGSEIYASARGDELVLAIGYSGEIRWIDREGGVRQIARRRWAERAVTESMIEGNRVASVRALAGQYGREPIVNAMIRERVAAETLPPFSALLLDSEGNAWVRSYEVSHATPTFEFIRTFPDPSTWSVFDPEGIWLGDVEMPPAFTPVEIGDGHVLGLARREMGVEEVRRYGIVKR